jgi:hypothetical protein
VRGLSHAVAAAVIIVTTYSSSSSAQEVIDAAREYQVKGVFLYSFGRYVEWPGDVHRDRFVIGVLGESKIHSTLAQVARRKTLKGQRIQIVRFDSPEQIEGCRILFISRAVSQEEELAALRTVRGQGVLVVGETPEFTHRGGGIGFQVHGSTVRFQINLAVTKEEDLQLDAKLLTIGEVVSFPVTQNVPARAMP